ncbi:hypothetical protein K469DRAFT_749003 [Zopfia rhizophila CBS 207.26]|uniref:Uncharacterized protein n=1 Tax=Zopfia rhizophila CBS 207.26 TaxID=1314779 RepID=A0A6A6E775_9PEZI|nr:hypothetical protein K469DRAFT_749003 [Zopfia rhizophila CBS 207.26]
MTIMDPHTKPPRILKSVEVDETNPDFMRRQQGNHLLLKSRFEAIFAKFENMPEEDQDEIDLETGKVVVDRGHLRSMQDDGRRGRVMQFLGHLSDEKEQYEEYEDDGDDRDELAPTEPSEASEPEDRDPVEETQAEAHNTAMSNIPPPTEMMNIPLQNREQTEVANSINSAQMTMQIAQLAQPIATMQPDTAAFAQLGQNIWGALAQFMGQYSGGVPGAVPPVAPGTVNTVTPPVVPRNVSGVTPVTNSTWYAPPIPEWTPRSVTAQSSPTSNSTAQRKRQPSPIRSIWAPQIKRKKQNAKADEPPDETLAAQRRETDLSTDDDVDRPSHHRRKYHFSAEDEEYIIKQKKEHKLSWKQIIESREAWKDWPQSAICRYYYKHLKDRGILNLEGRREESPLLRDANEEIEEQVEDQADTGEAIETSIASMRLPKKPARTRLRTAITKTASSPTRPRQLPTPSTLDHLNSTDSQTSTTRNYAPQLEELAVPNIPDDDDMEISHMQSEELRENGPAVAHDTVASSIPPDEILPSVETVNHVSEEVGDENTNPMATPDAQEPQFVKPQTPTRGKLKPVSKKTSRSALTSAQKQRDQLDLFMVDSDDDDLNLVTAFPSDKGGGITVSDVKSYACDICAKRFKNEGGVEHHHKLAPTCKAKSNPGQLSNQNDPDSLDESDDLAPPSSTMHTPRKANHAPIPSNPDQTDEVEIKQEPSTPLTLLSTSSLYTTPKSAPQPTLSSSATKSDLKVRAIEKNKWLKNAKAQWARSGRRGTPRPEEGRRRRSLQILIQKRDEESDDELA